MSDPTPAQPAPRVLGPCLILDTIDGATLHIAALFVTDRDDAPPAPVTTDGTEIPPELLARFPNGHVWCARFTRPADRPSHYTWQNTRYELASDMTSDLRLAFASCNGEEHDDLTRDETERNVMWARLAQQHRTAPFSLLLHGGDQIYADEATKGHPLSDEWPEKVSKTPDTAALDTLETHLQDRFFERYVTQLAQADYAWLVARVPSLMIWDDHDICDGWGSLQRSRTGSAVGQTLFRVARTSAQCFQHAATPDAPPARFWDPSLDTLGWQVEAPGLRIVAPDLRAERTRRDVMGPKGWDAMTQAAEAPFSGKTFVMSSVPLLGPRLSILESLMVAIPRMQKYEDDLRDQWQSRAHRASWQRMLGLVMQMQENDDDDVTILSGEIHLATWAAMAARNGQRMEQLVASGVTHRPPPRAWARALHYLAALGESPLPGHPIRIRRIPGQRLRYAAERNTLILERHGGAWQAIWDFEHSGMSPALPI